MSKRYEEPADVEAPDGTIAAFWWRGRRYRVEAVLSRWREAGGWWEGASDAGQPWVRGDAREIWRVDAVPEPQPARELPAREPDEPERVPAIAAPDRSARTRAARAALKTASKGRHPSGRKLRRIPAGTYELCRDLRRGTWSLFRVWD